MQIALVYLQSAATGGGLLTFLPILAVFAIFYFMLILPAKRQRTATAKMLRELKTGDRVLTAGGVRGVISTLNEQTLVLTVKPDNLKLEMQRSAVTQKLDGTES